MTILNPGRPRRLTAEFYDTAGRPARVDGSPFWAVSNPDAVEIIPTASDFAVRIVRKEPPVFGPVEVTATADADLGEGVREMILRATFSIPEPEAEAGELVVGEEEVPPAPEPDPIPEPVPEPTPEPVVVDVAPVVEEVIPAPAEQGIVFEPVPVEEAKPADPPLDPPPEADRPTE